MPILKLSTGAKPAKQPAIAKIKERIRRARLISFDSATWIAIVRLDGSMSNTDLPVGQWVTSNEMTTNSYYAVLLLDDTNPNDGVIVGPYGGIGDNRNLTIANTAPSITLTDTTASAKGLTIAVDANIADFRESAGASGSLLVLNLANNRVGIGTAAPNAKFHISSPDTAAIALIAGVTKALRIGASANFAEFQAVDNTGFASYQPLVMGGSAITFTSSGLTRITLSSAGNLGIGITAPTGKLDILGTLTVASAAGAVLRDLWMEPATITITGATNITTATGFNFAEFGIPTFSNASIAVSLASTVYIAGPPTPTGGMTITNAYSLWVDSGVVRIDQGIALGGGVAPTLGTIGGAGPTVAAQNEWIQIDTQNGVRFVPAWA